MVNKTKVHEHIVRLVQEKTHLRGITAVRELMSNREGVRFVIEVKRDAQPMLSSTISSR